jgi:hypothetical protein
MTQRLTHQEWEFEEAGRYLDVEVLALELEYSEELRAGLREALDRRQAEFDRRMESQPKAIAERERWKKNREESERRAARLKAERQVIPADVAARQLAQRWGVKLVS